MPFVLYIASVAGALGLLLMLPKRGLTLTALGAVLGAAALGGVWIAALLWRDPAYGGADSGGSGLFWWLPDASGERTAILYYYVFSLIAIGAAARVITHTRPVYSALWFIMVILASAGLFLTLSAEFMAFAMVIIYAGAILVTYMFVIMLATQSANPDFKQGGDAAESPEYDRFALDPIAAVVAGFLMLAVLLTVAFQPMTPNTTAQAPADADVIESVLPHRTPLAVALEINADAPESVTTNLPEMSRLTNAEGIGLDLFASHPLGLELAGVILTVALIGAVVIARTRVPEEEATATLVTPQPTREPGPHEPGSIGEVGGRIGA